MQVVADIRDVFLQILQFVPAHATLRETCKGMHRHTDLAAGVACRTAVSLWQVTVRLSSLHRRTCILVAGVDSDIALHWLLTQLQQPVRWFRPGSNAVRRYVNDAPHEQHVCVLHVNRARLRCSASEKLIWARQELGTRVVVVVFEDHALVKKRMDHTLAAHAEFIVYYGVRGNHFRKLTYNLHNRPTEPSTRPYHRRAGMHLLDRCRPGHCWARVPLP
jgi:hypothetical protein